MGRKPSKDEYLTQNLSESNLDESVGMVELKLTDEQKCFIAICIAAKDTPSVIMAKLFEGYPEFKTANQKAILKAITDVKQDAVWRKYIAEAGEQSSKDPVEFADVASPMGRLKIISDVIKKELSKGVERDNATISTFIRLAEVETRKIAASKDGVQCYEDFIKMIMGRIEKYGILKRKAQVG